MQQTAKISIKELTQYARGQLVGRYGIAILLATFPAVVEFTVSTLLGSSDYSTNASYFLSIAITLVIDLLMGIFIYGQSLSFVKLARGVEQPRPSDLFYGFKNNMDKAIILQVPYTVASLLCLIPSILIQLGVIQVEQNKLLTFEFAYLLVQQIIFVIINMWLGMSFYILSDNPDMEAVEIFKTSAEMMKGNRLKYALVYIVSIPLVLVSFLACCFGVFVFEGYFKTILANIYLLLKGERPWSINNHFDQRV